MSAADERAKAIEDRLRKLSRTEYELQRAALSKEFGVRVTGLDAIFEAISGARASKTEAQPKADVWPEPVDGAKLLESIAFQLGRYVVAEESAIDACALWTAHAHAHDAFEVSPLLLISSPVKGCGKSTLHDVIEQLVPRPLASANSSASALYRSTGDGPATRPTILCDEADLFFGEDRNLIAFFNAGHRRGVPFLRTEGQETRRVVAFDSWAPKLLAQIGMPKWPTVVDRSIVIRLRRKGPGEHADRFRKSHPHPDLVALRQQCSRWAADHLDELRQLEPGLPEALDNRAADNWAPLFAIAQLAGERWPKRVRDTAKALQHTDEDRRLELLADLRALFASDASKAFWPTAMLIQGLVDLDERPYSTMNNGKPVNAHWLSRQLRGFDLHSAQERRPDGTTTKVRGWHVSAFKPVFDAYLPPLPSSEASEASEAGPPGADGFASDASHASHTGSAGEGASPNGSAEPEPKPEPEYAADPTADLF